MNKCFFNVLPPDKYSVNTDSFYLDFALFKNVRKVCNVGIYQFFLNLIQHSDF